MECVVRCDSEEVDAAMHRRYIEECIRYRDRVRSRSDWTAAVGLSTGRRSAETHLPHEPGARP
jgi:hypothetical protein